MADEGAVAPDVYNQNGRELDGVSALRPLGHAIQGDGKLLLGADIAGQSEVAAERFATAHRALRANPDIQFDLHRVPPPRPTPGWLRAIGEWLGNVLRPIGRFLDWLSGFLPDAPYARILLWTVLIAAALALGWMGWTRWKDGVWRLPRLRRRRPNTSEPAEEDYWQPEVAPARAWLEEADVLAAEGRFAEAAHHLLIRSVEDIGRRRPGLVRPALTSRDLARAPAVPPLARQLFAGIAAVVERSLFGGRPVDANDWGECRAAYADFAKTASWKAAA